MSFKYISVFYNSDLFQNGYDHIAYQSFLQDIKNNKLVLSKIIYEKDPLPIHNKKNFSLSIDHNRYISDHNDQLLLFSVGEKSDVVLLWYEEYNTKKHVSIYNGKALIIDLYPSLYHNIFIQENNSLLSCLLCDFQFFNIPSLMKKNSNKSFDFNSKYNII